MPTWSKHRWQVTIKGHSSVYQNTEFRQILVFGSNWWTEGTFWNIKWPTLSKPLIAEVPLTQIMKGWQHPYSASQPQLTENLNILWPTCGYNSTGISSLLGNLPGVGLWEESMHVSGQRDTLATHLAASCGMSPVTIHLTMTTLAFLTNATW